MTAPDLSKLRVDRDTPSAGVSRALSCIAAAAAIGAGVVARPVPPDLTGKWFGGVNSVDFTTSPYCERWGPAVLDLIQTGDSVTGNMTVTFSNARRLRADVNLPCQPFPERTDQIRGAVSGTSVTFRLSSTAVPVEYQGTFTSDLMRGTFVAGAENRGGARGCWQVARTGAIADCANPFK